MSERITRWLLLPPCLMMAACISSTTKEAPKQQAQALDRLLASPESLADPLALPVAEGRTSTVFRGEENVTGFNLHSYIAHHDGKFWAIWSSSKVGEEDPDQHVRYASSADGHTWSKSQTLVADPDGPDKPARWIARGVYVNDEGKLTALAAYIESADYGKRGKEAVWKNLRLMRFEWDGKAWRDKGVFANNCMNNFPPERLGGKLALVCRDDGMNVAMALAEGPGEWKVTPLQAAPPYDKMDEPTFYSTSDSEVHMIIRDNSKSGYLLRALSKDAGKTWTAPVRTNFPDATSKNFPGKLSNGWYFLINNPNPKERNPLAVSFSRDGWAFEKTLAVRKDGPERRFAGRAKRSGSLQYPHAIEHGGSLWVIYATNKEDIDVTELPIAKLGLASQ